MSELRSVPLASLDLIFDPFDRPKGFQGNGIQMYFSWGLMQTLGRWSGRKGSKRFKGPFASLCDPETGLEAGCTHFKRKLDVADGSIPKALLLWNGGNASGYPAEVVARIPKYKT
jgi:soluble lytic murein transglycosylase-like protein